MAVEQQTAQGQTPERGPAMQEIVAVVSGIAGFLLAGTWYLGRRYAAGYFTSQNIPVYQPSFSVWEYVEQGWQFTYMLITIPAVILFAIKVAADPRGDIRNLPIWAKIILSGVLVVGALATQRFVPYPYQSVVVALWILSLVVIGVFVPNLLLKKGSNDPLTHFPYSGRISFVLVFGFFLLIYLGRISYNTGAVGGRRSVTDMPLQVRIVSDAPLMIDAPQFEMATAGSSTLYTYGGLRLLTFNDKHYYLFKSIDAGCKPEQVYIVEEAQLKHVAYEVAEPLKLGCTPTGTLAPHATTEASPAATGEAPTP